MVPMSGTLEAAMAGGYHVTLVLLDHPDAEKWRAKRSKEIGKVQNEGWVKGRLSASRSLATWAVNSKLAGKDIEAVVGHPDAVVPLLQPILDAR